MPKTEVLVRRVKVKGVARGYPPNGRWAWDLVGSMGFLPVEVFSI